jgi:hypothetical protein
LYSFHSPPCIQTSCGTVQLICLLVSCIVVAVLVRAVYSRI